MSCVMSADLSLCVYLQLGAWQGW